MFIGVDIGGTKILAARAGDDLKLVDSRKISTPSTGKDGLTAIASLIEDLAGGEPIQAIGVASPGPLDFSRGIILNPPNMEWDNVRVVDHLSRHFEVPVALENDANAGALAEATIGSGRKHHFVLYVTISTGVGTGLVAGGAIYRGAHDVEGGHIAIVPDGPVCSCGGHGHFEAMVSGRAIKQRFGKYAYEITDPKQWDELAADIGMGLGSMINMVSPDVVVLGGGVNVHYDKFRKFLAQHLKAVHTIYPQPPIVPAQFMETAPVYGALILAQHKAKTN